MNEDEIKKEVRNKYGQIAKQGSSCCGPVKSCCGSAGIAERISENIGYTGEEIHAVPDGANLGLGCGNPLALASLKEGETVLDLGSGAGFDSFLASPRVGEGGRVIGVIHQRSEDHGAGCGQRTLRPPFMQRRRVTFVNVAFSNAGFVDGFQGQGDFDEFFAVGGIIQNIILLCLLYFGIIIHHIISL